MNEIRLPATLENWPKVSQFAETLLEAQACPPRAQIQLLIALEELYVNIAHYAYPAETGDAVIRFLADDEQIGFELSDTGVPFNPLERADPELTIPVAQRPIGGMGIYMVKKSMDVFIYEYRDGQNIKRIAKKAVQKK